MSKDPPSQSYGVADSRFWRNVTLIALAHVALLLGLIRWSVEARNSSNAQSIVWISGAEDLAAGEPQSSESPQPATPKASEATPPPESDPLEKDDAPEETPIVTAAKSEIELPTPTPIPTSTSKPTTTPTAKPKVTPKQTPKPTLKKTLVAKASPKPSPKAKSSPTKSAEEAKKTNANAEKKKIAKTESSSQASGKTNSAGKVGRTDSGSTPSEFGWYGNMLHDRFYSAWIQPTTNIASGAKISTLIKVRIEKDGRVSSFEIIKPSENIIVNESVAAIAKRVTQVDPPPAGFGNGDHYDVKINFELNTDQGAGNR